MSGPSTITGLPASAAITGAEVLPMDQGGNGKSVSSTVANIITGSAASTAIVGTELLLQSPTAGSVKNTSVAQLVTQATGSSAIVGTELVPNTASGTYQSTSVSQLITQSSASASIAGTELLLQSPAANSVKKTSVAQLTTQATASGALAGTESFPNVTAGGVYQKSTIAQVVTAALTQQPPNTRNYFVDPGCRVAQGSVPNLSTSYQYGAVDLVQCKASGSAVSAGQILQAGPLGISTSAGYTFKVAGATITGAGIVFARRWLERVDAQSLAGSSQTNNATFSCVVYHTVGSNINYTITINAANALNNFSTTTNVGTSGNISVPTATATTISFTVALTAGAANNGIEMVVQAACGAVTTKDFHFTDWQAVQGPNVLPIQYAPFIDDYLKVQRYFEKSYEYGTAPGSIIFNGAFTIPNPIATANSGSIMAVPFRVNKVISPTLTAYSPISGATAKMYDATAGTDIAISITGDSGRHQIFNNSGGALTANHFLTWHFTADARL